MGQLDGQVALITGAANGLGATKARMLAAEGAAVVLTDIDDRNGRAIQSDITKAGGRAILLHLDVTNAKGWTQAIAATLDEFGGLNVLVNNAGVVPRQTLEETNLATWEKTLAINLTGPMLGMQICAPVIRDTGGGSIINVSSAAGLIAHYDAAYTASKWGLRGLTKTAAVEYAPWGIRVNSIHPGIIFGTALGGSENPAIARSAKACIPMQRAGTTQECAELVLFLASDASSFITGTEIPVDGGYSSGATMWMRDQLKQKTVGQ